MPSHIIIFFLLCLLLFLTDASTPGGKCSTLSLSFSLKKKEKKKSWFVKGTRLWFDDDYPHVFPPACISQRKLNTS